MLWIAGIIVCIIASQAIRGYVFHRRTLRWGKSLDEREKAPEKRP